MSTKSRIGIEYKDKSVKSIYCHFDGYAGGVGNRLLENYNTQEKVEALLNLGDLSVLGREIGKKQSFNQPNKRWCLAYGRDRGEDNTEATHSKTAWEFIAKLGEDYNYLFDLFDNTWYVVRASDRNDENSFVTVKLSELLDAESSDT